MKKSDLPRHQMIESLAARHPEEVADDAINAWEQVAVKIIAIVGEGGFNSLYARSVLLTQPTFPWLTATAPAPPAGHRFAILKTDFESQTPALAIEANRLLLITFTDILASLIGERLTTRILRSAWGDDAPDRAGKEPEK